MPGPLITQKDISTGAVSPQRRVFDEVRGKMREALVFFYFRSSAVPVSMPHSLGRTPSQFRVVRVARAGGAVPGAIYAPTQFGSSPTQMDAAYNFTATHITLQCETANTYCEVVVS